MRCLHLIHRYWPARGGSEKFFIELSERLAADGNDVTVFTTDAIDIQHYWLPGKEHIDIAEDVHNDVRIQRFEVMRFPKHAQALRVLGKLPGMTAKSLFSFPSPFVPGMCSVVTPKLPRSRSGACSAPSRCRVYPRFKSTSMRADMV